MFITKIFVAITWDRNLDIYGVKFFKNYKTAKILAFIHVNDKQLSFSEKIISAYNNLDCKIDDKVILGGYSSSSAAFDLNIPKMPNADVEKFLTYDLAEYLPFPVENLKWWFRSVIQEDNLKVKIYAVKEGEWKENIKTVEEAGLTVVDDDMYIGGRYFESDVSTDGSAFDALARYQWEKIPCVSKIGTDRTYEDYLLDLVKRSGAEGVVDFHWKFCPFQFWERPFIKECLNKAGIPYMEIDLGEEAQALEALRTRLEAFGETIKGVK